MFYDFDTYFPYFVLSYGIVMVSVLRSQYLMKIAETKLSWARVQQFRSHLWIGYWCLIVGSLWSLQSFLQS